MILFPFIVFGLSQLNLTSFFQEPAAQPKPYLNNTVKLNKMQGKGVELQKTHCVKCLTLLMLVGMQNYN